MSYILEALKRSQQERSRGEVPTLSSELPAAGRPQRPPRLNLWALSAMLLAGLAVLIASYGVFLQLGERIEPVAQRAPLTPAPADIKPPSATPEPPATEKDSARRASAPAIDGEQSSQLRPPVKPAVGGASRSPARPRGPAVIAPPVPSPKQTPAVEGGLRQQAEELRRSLVETVPRGKAESPAPPTHKPQASPPRSTPATVSSTPVRPAARRSAAPRPSLDSLPPDVAEQLPPIRVLAHSYRADPQRRFVILNSQKLRQGELSDSGLRVLEILPDGMDLEFQGHAFFVRR